ncbi:MAG: Mut7-C RNAse domain-containing protein [Candidatus Atribacteria bacterium]|nr:Mut7-C RNAse domain-containing protein [Candidatus Atribacteria bacterium]
MVVQPAPCYNGRTVENIRFLVDCMLGKLARWLRIMGFDTLYVRYIDDRKILAQARFENRMILTKDTGLFQKAGKLGYFVQSEQYGEQLREIMVAFYLLPGPFFCRCPACNTLLCEVSQDEAKNTVPLYVSRSFSSFKKCPKCHKMYWPGTHWQGMKKICQRVLEK